MSAARRAGFNADRRVVSVPVAIVAAGIALALFLVSFEGLSYVGHLMGLDDMSVGGIRLGDASWLVPVALDALIVVATLLAIIRRAQRRKAELEWAIVYVATAASSAANFASHMQRDQGWLAALVAASMPIFLLFLSHAIIRTLIESESPAPKPKRVAPSVASVEASAAPVNAPARPARPSAPRASRASRASAGSIPNSYPFDEVMGMSEDVLLAEFDALAVHPETGVRGSAESPRFSAVAWRLVEAHGHSLAELARRAGHADSAKLKDRVRKVREKAPATV